MNVKSAKLYLSAAAVLFAVASPAADLARFVAISNSQQVVWLTVAAPTNGTAWLLQVADLPPDGWRSAEYADAGKCYSFFRLYQVRPFDADWKARFNALKKATEELDPAIKNLDVLDNLETEAPYDPVKCIRNYYEAYRKLRSSWEALE